VLVTGGGTGLGKAIAVEFARPRRRVAISRGEDRTSAAGVAAVESRRR
jgi:NAD(P)-dependent dehydrogenase (short-subunit alcohol dehydrogenase family)